MNKDLEQTIRSAIELATDKISVINEIKELLFAMSPEKENPVDRVIWVPKDDVVANDYNPNSVASKELHLLYLSIKEDGYTQPIVTVRDEERGKYVIIDGFHRNLISKRYTDIAQRNHGMLPIVVLEKNIDERMAATVRHNRARGTHSVQGMSNILYKMMRDGKSEREICNALGMEPKEFVKLSYITGFAKLFKNYHYSQSVEKFISEQNIDDLS